MLYLYYKRAHVGCLVTFILLALANAATLILTETKIALSDNIDLVLLGTVPLAIGHSLPPLSYNIQNQRVIRSGDSLIFVGVPGLEPGKTGPESVVLPITPYPKLSFANEMPSRFGCKSTTFFQSDKQQDPYFFTK